MKRLYLSQINNSFGGQAFLPYSVGMLWSYAQSQPDIAAAYELGGLLFLREPLDAALQKIHDPDVLALSCYLWNWNYNMALMRKVRQLYPSCVIILGGPEVPSSGFAIGESEFFNFLTFIFQQACHDMAAAFGDQIGFDVPIFTGDKLFNFGVAFAD